MNQGLFRILYCSRNLTGTLEHDRGDALGSILQASRRNNYARRVTGALLYSSGLFAQVLEGPRVDIEHVFERIQRDARHTDVTVLECAEIATRDFPAWSMARVEPVSVHEEAEAARALYTAMGSPGESGQDVLHLLRSLAVQEA